MNTGFYGGCNHGFPGMGKLIPHAVPGVNKIVSVVFPEDRLSSSWAVTVAGLDVFRFHDLRHTFAARLNAAEPIPAIRDLLSHSSTTMTENYTQTSSETRRKVIGAMGCVVSELRQTETEWKREVAVEC